MYTPVSIFINFVCAETWNGLAKLYDIGGCDFTAVHVWDIVKRDLLSAQYKNFPFTDKISIYKSTKPWQNLRGAHNGTQD